MRTSAIVVIIILLILAASAMWLVSGRLKSTVVQSTPQTTNELTAVSPTPPSPQISPLPQKVNVTLKTSLGDIAVELDGTVAPLTVGNFVQLAESNFYDGTAFHRVIPDFMIQAGDPLSRDHNNRLYHGTGGPNYEFADEINPNKIVRGTLAMANAGPNTNGSQFFIVTAAATPHLDGKHTYFGKVTSGMEVVDAISAVDRDERDNPLTPVVIQDVVVSR